ncbi:MAG: T9SS type A sorting domain-containing protein [Bacteroidia bacterium]|nr:T9SS type A sorting domain-containing protein [Bacteroidia bacterium]MDW8301142.1 T9SS type A sorting domain-containing protein [Bacteroidia bacterium]
MKKYVTILLLSVFLSTVSAFSLPYPSAPEKIDDQNLPILGEVIIYPNPITESATITFTLSKTEPVTIEIYSLIGQKVATIAKNEVFHTGVNSITINKDALKLTSSLYLLSITCDGKTKNYKLFVR